MSTADIIRQAGSFFQLPPDVAAEAEETLKLLRALIDGRPWPRTQPKWFVGRAELSGTEGVVTRFTDSDFQNFEYPFVLTDIFTAEADGTVVQDYALRVQDARTRWEVLGNTSTKQSAATTRTGYISRFFLNDYDRIPRAIAHLDQPYVVPPEGAFIVEGESGGNVGGAYEVEVVLKGYWRLP